MQADVQRGGQPISLRDEILALLSGVRIINIDTPRTMQFKVTEYGRKKRSVTATEKFFSLEDFRQRGPNVLAEEFRQIQEENLKVNRDFYVILQDAQTMGVDKRTLKKILKQRGISTKNANFLLRGKNIPYTGYKGRMQKRVKDAKVLSKKLGEGNVNANYFYPRKLFNDILREYRRKSIVPKEETDSPGLIDRGLDAVGDLFGGVPENQPVAQIQTPPLPNTPQPRVRTTQQINPTTNLTRTETALLSPEEQVIASRKT